MRNITFQIENKFEYYRIISVLEDYGIPYASKIYTDSNFPVLGQIRPYAEISVAKENEAMVRSIIEGNDTGSADENKVEEGKPLYHTPKKKFDYVKVGLMVYALIATVLLVKYWYMVNNSSENKNFSYEWNYNNTELSEISKNTGLMVNKSFDKNYDYNFEKTRSYSEGYRIAEWFDFNEDGFYEESHSYNYQNERVGSWFDINNDGWIERVELMLENKDTLIFTDHDKNGYWELKK